MTPTASPTLRAARSLLAAFAVAALVSVVLAVVGLYAAAYALVGWSADTAEQQLAEGADDGE